MNRIREIEQGIKMAGRELAQLAKEPRLYIVLIFVFCFLKRRYDNEMYYITLNRITPCFWEIWPYASCSYEKMIIVWCGFLVIVSDLPRQGERMINCLIRTRKWVFAFSQQIYLLGISVQYLFFIQISQYVYFKMQCTWENQWTNYTKRILVDQLGQSTRIAFENKPISMFLLSIVLFGFLLMIIGMIILISNLYMHRIVGYICVAILIALDILLQLADIPRLHFVSPVTLARLTGLDLGYSYELPDVWYAAVVLSGLFLLLSGVLYSHIRKYDF